MQDIKKAMLSGTRTITRPIWYAYWCNELERLARLHGEQDARAVLAEHSPRDVEAINASHIRRSQQRIRDLYKQGASEAVVERYAEVAGQAYYESMCQFAKAYDAEVERLRRDGAARQDRT